MPITLFWLLLASTGLFLVDCHRSSRNFNQFPCDECQSLARQAKAWLEAKNQTRDAIESMLAQHICPLILPNEPEDVCDQLVSDLYDLSWLMLEQAADAGEICHTIGICRQQQQSISECNQCLTLHRHSRKQQPWGSLEKCSRMGACPTRDLPMKATCSQCQDVLTKMKARFVDDSFSLRVRDILIGKACKGIFSFKCRFLLKKFWPNIMRSVQKMKTAEACNLFKMCPAVHSSVPGLCDLCEMVLKQVLELVGKNMNKDALEDALNKVCKLIPSIWQSSCSWFVHEYSGKIIDALISGKTPHLACCCIGVCLEQNLLPIARIRSSSCQNCLDVTATFKDQWQNQSFVDGLLQKILSSCRGAMAPFCRSQVKNYWPVLVDSMRTFKPASSCQLFSQC